MSQRNCFFLGSAFGEKFLVETYHSSVTSHPTEATTEVEAEPITETEESTMASRIPTATEKQNNGKMYLVETNGGSANENTNSGKMYLIETKKGPVTIPPSVATTTNIDEYVDSNESSGDESEEYSYEDSEENTTTGLNIFRNGRVGKGKKPRRGSGEISI